MILFSSGPNSRLEVSTSTFLQWKFLMYFVQVNQILIHFKSNSNLFAKSFITKCFEWCTTKPCKRNLLWLNGVNLIRNNFSKLCFSKNYSLNYWRKKFCWILNLINNPKELYLPITSFISCECVKADDLIHMDLRNTCQKNKTIKESTSESRRNYYNILILHVEEVRLSVHVRFIHITHAWLQH